MEDFNDYDNGWYDGDDLREMGDREAWEDSRDLGDLYDLEDEDEDDDECDCRECELRELRSKCDW